MNAPVKVLGWRKNPPGKEPPAARAMLARLRADEVEPLPKCSLLSFGPRRLFQGYVGSCVSVGTKGMVLDWCAANGEEPFEVAEQPLYWQSRVLEYSDPELARDADDVRRLVIAAGDTGAYPWLAFRAWKETGLVPFSECPISDPRTNNEIDQFLNYQPAPAMFAKGYKHRGLQTSTIDSFGVDKVRELASLLKLRVPVGFGMRVDWDFMQNEGEEVISINEHMVQGGHWMRCLAVCKGWDFGASPPSASAEEMTALLESFAIYDPSEVDYTCSVVFHNTWHEWGLPNGMGIMSAQLWALYARDVTGIRKVPVR